MYFPMRHLLRRVFLAPAVGNILEFYDFALYGFLMPIMAPLFFPAENVLNSIFMGFGVFAIGFLSRPLGGFFFGYIGDKHGRKTALSLSLILMGIFTFLIGCLPTYQAIGILSPMLFTFLRFLQGFCLGGEFSGSLLFASSHIDQKLKSSSALITSFVTAAGVSGWFLGSLICKFFSENNSYLIDGWRWPFLIGSLVALVGAYIRKHTIEAPFIEEKKQETMELPTLIKKGIPTGLAISGIGMLMGVLFYGFYIFPNSFLPQVTNLSLSSVIQCSSYGIAMYMIFLPLMGVLSDRTNHYLFMSISSILTIFLAYPIFLLLMSGKIAEIIIAQVLTSLLLSGFMAPATFIMTLYFPPQIRQRAVSLSYNLGACIWGGTTPAIFLTIYQFSGSKNALFIYVSFAGFIGLISSLFLYKKRFEMIKS